jgi:O-antigen/teichoic acid export membrane protein
VYSYFTAKKQLRELTIFQIVNRLWGVLTLVLAILFLKKIVWILLVYFVSSVMFNLFLFFKVKRRLVSKEIEPEVVKTGVQITLTGIIPQLLNNFDKMILPVFAGVESLALYAVAVKIPDTLKGFLNSLDNLILPKMVGSEGKVLIKKLFNNWVVGIFITGLIVLVLCLPFAIRLLFGSGYQEAIRISQVYALAIIPLFFRRVLNNWMLANNESGMYFKNQTLWSVSTSIFIVLGLVLYPGIMAVVLAKLAGAVLAVANGIFLIKKRTQKI